MSNNIIRLQKREDNKGYELLESGVNGNDFLSFYQSFFIPIGRFNLICAEGVKKDIRFGSLEEDISSTVREVSNNLAYAKRIVLELARQEAMRVMDTRRLQGYVFEDLTQQ